jgi:hypothetical protein
MMEAFFLFIFDIGSRRIVCLVWDLNVIPIRANPLLCSSAPCSVVMIYVMRVYNYVFLGYFVTLRVNS